MDQRSFICKTDPFLSMGYSVDSSLCKIILHKKKEADFLHKKKRQIFGTRRKGADFCHQKKGADFLHMKKEADFCQK